jgi:hypothetical protein
VGEGALQSVGDVIWGRESASEKARNEKAVKPLKTNKTAKSLIQRL